MVYLIKYPKFTSWTFRGISRTGNRSWRCKAHYRYPQIKNNNIFDIFIALMSIYWLRLSLLPRVVAANSWHTPWKWSPIQQSKAGHSTRHIAACKKTHPIYLTDVPQLIRVNVKALLLAQLARIFREQDAQQKKGAGRWSSGIMHKYLRPSTWPCMLISKVMCGLRLWMRRGDRRESAGGATRQGRHLHHSGCQRKRYRQVGQRKKPRRPQLHLCPNHD